MFVVVEIFQGVLQRVYGPFNSLKRAERKARSLCEEPVYDSDKGSQEYPATPDIEVVVCEVNKFGGTVYLTLAK